MNNLKCIPLTPVKPRHQPYIILGYKYIHYIMGNNATFKTCDGLLQQEDHLRKVHEVQTNM